MKKAAIYNPYLDTLGGGELYTAYFAKALVSAGYTVYLQWGNLSIKDKVSKRFGIDLNNIFVLPDIKRGDGFDVCFWVSDGSIPALKARDNFLHFQIPFHGVNGKSLLNKFKLNRVKKIICNSYFTKEFIDKEYGVESIVIYPAVSVEKFNPKRKENVICSVGRFSKLTQAKRQDIQVKAFIKLCKSGLTDWRLVLAGGTEGGGNGLV